MTALTNEELLKLCDEVIYATQPGEYTAMTNGEMAKVCEDAAPHLARALKSRLQAEAPTDAEVAEIEKRHAGCEGFYAGHGGYRPDWHKDRTILLAKLRATSQAEAQAPTTAPTREQIAALLADFRGWNFEKLDMWSDDRYGQKHYLKQADAILALLAKGDTPAPKHALHCGYWLDLNCSCKLEGDTP